MRNINNIPEQIQRSGSTTNHELGPTPDSAHAVQLPVVHLRLYIRLLVPQIKTFLIGYRTHASLVELFSNDFDEADESRWRLKKLVNADI